jgi:hypothetical protein
MRAELEQSAVHAWALIRFLLPAALSLSMSWYCRGDGIIAGQEKDIGVVG